MSANSNVTDSELIELVVKELRVRLAHVTVTFANLSKEEQLMQKWLEIAQQEGFKW